MSWLLIALAVGLAAAQNVISVDDTDSSIVYSGSWEPATEHPSTLDYGGFHTLSSDPSASATFTFTGVAVDYLAPKWPYTVDSYVSLDGGAPVLVDMTALGTPNIDGHETVQSAALWSATGLQNTIHHLVVTIGTSGYAVVDGFRYTQGSTTTTSSQQSTSTPTSTSTSSNSGAITSASHSTATSQQDNSSGTTSSNNNSLIIAVSVSVGVAIILLFLIGLVLIDRRRKARRLRMEASDDVYGAPPMAAIGNARPYMPVAPNDPSYAYQIPGQEYAQYGTRPYSLHSSDMSQNDTLRSSNYGQYLGPNRATSPAQYGLYPPGVSHTAANIVTPPGSPPASPNSQTRLTVPTYQPDQAQRQSYQPPPPNPMSPLSAVSTEPPPYAPQFSSPTQPTAPQVASSSTSQAPPVTQFTDPPKRRYDRSDAKRF